MSGNVEQVIGREREIACILTIRFYFLKYVAC